jgi:diaminopimelate epimerase
MQFSTWHALGNTYVLVEPGEGPVIASVARALTHPATGAKADGVIEVVCADGDEATIVIWNPDGSVAEISGNGTRIAAKWLANRSGSTAVTIETGGRALRARLLQGDLVETELGEVTVEPSLSIDLDGETVVVTPVLVGNPHAVVTVEELDRATLQRVGPKIEAHPRFPRRTNVQLARIDGTHDVSALVWERGVGETTSSGSSAVAVAAVAIARAGCENPVTVNFPGGELVVSVESGRATLVGPAVRLSDGEIEL